MDTSYLYTTTPLKRYLDDREFNVFKRAAYLKSPAGRDFFFSPVVPTFSRTRIDYLAIV